MDAAQLAEVERWASTLYSGGTPAEQMEAQKRLVPLGENPDFIPQCQYIIDNSSNPYALSIGAQSLTRLISAHWNSFTPQQRVQIRNYVLGYLASKGPGLEGFVITTFIQLVCRITKLGWFDEDPGPFREIVKETTKFLQHKVVHCVIGLKILTTLVLEVNHRSSKRTMTQHRKVAVSFRDRCLLQVFEISLTILNQLACRSISLEGYEPAKREATENQLLDQALQLAVACLRYDFIGTNPDESAEDTGTLQVPVSWRERLQSQSTPRLFFSLYKGLTSGFISASPSGQAAASGFDVGVHALGSALPPVHAAAVVGPEKPFIKSLPRAAQALEVLTLLVSVRRSLFAHEADRRRFLLNIMSGLIIILQSKAGLDDQGCYHNFCRLLGRVKANYQLSELIRTDGYAEWMRLAAEFAVNGFNKIAWAPSSVHYILGLWSRMVAAVPYVRVDPKTEPMLDVYAPKIVEAYIKARVSMVEAVFRGDVVENDLDNPDRIHEELEQLPGICRFQFEATRTSLLSVMDPALQRYNEQVTLARTAPSDALTTQIRMTEQQLAWLVYIVSSIIGGQSFGSMSTRPGDELIDADLCRRVLQLMTALDMRIASTGGAAKWDSRLELALLYFIANFRKAYISEQRGMPNPAIAAGDRPHAMSAKEKLFRMLFERIGMGDHHVVVSNIIQKLCNNLRFFPEDSDVVSETLDMMSELTSSYSSSNLLLRLDAVKYVLSHHTPEHFPFLETDGNSRFRTQFYSTLARLLYMSETADHFETFMKPLLARVDSLAPHIHNRVPPVMKSLSGIFRDLLGVASATHNRRTYGWLFDAIYPRHLPVLVKSAEIWSDTPEVMTPLVKFMCELVYNKAQRIQFDNVSPNGILLFREASALLVAHGNRILVAPPPPAPELYAKRYKGVHLLFLMLARALDGSYVNFGVFTLYKDKALDDALECALKLALSIPQGDLTSYPKLAVSYFMLMSVLFRSHLRVIVGLPPPTFSIVLECVKSGVDSLSGTVSTFAAAALDHFAAYLVRHVRKEDETTRLIRAQLTAVPNLFFQLMGWLFQLAVFDESQNQWSLARALLSVILASEVVMPKALDQFKESLLRTQPPEIQPKLKASLDKLMVGISTSLDPSNRDRFTQRVTVFRIEVRGFLQL